MTNPLQPVVTLAPSLPMQVIVSQDGASVFLAQAAPGLTTTPAGPASGDLGGTYPSPQVTATHLASPLPIGQGGTGQQAQQAAINALTGAQSSGTYLRSNGTNATLTAIQAGDLPAATNSTQGAVELAGDLGGTAASPQVLSTHLSAALPVGQGGTGQVTQQAALDALAGAVTAGDYLRGNGTHVVLAAIQAGDVPVLNQNTTGTASNITDTLDQVPAPAANVSLNGHKATNLANGTVATDAAAFGQIPAALPPNGAAGGDLSGTYPNPTVAKIGGTAVSLPISLANGGTGTSAASANAAYNALSPMTTTGDLEYESGAGTAARLAGNTSATKKFLTQTGTGTVSAAPAWGTIATGDVPTLNQNTTGTSANITSTLDQVPAPAADVSLNSHKITSLANGSAATDGAAFGQIPVVDNTATDIKALGAQSAGSSGKWPNSDHVHPTTGLVTSVAATDTSIVVGGTSQAPTIATATLDVIAADHPPAANWSNNSHKITALANGTAATDAAAFGQTPAGGAIVSGQFLCNPHRYAPASQTALAVTATSLAAFSTGNVCTNSFTAPPSGSVLVRATFVCEETTTAGKIAALALAATGTTSPLFGDLVTVEINAITSVVPMVAEFNVTGLTPGNSFQFDLLGAVASGNFTIVVIGTQTVNLVAGGLGGPAILTVQAI